MTTNDVAVMKWEGNFFSFYTLFFWKRRALSPSEQMHFLNGFKRYVEVMGELIGPYRTKQEINTLRIRINGGWGRGQNERGVTQ